MTSRFHLLGTLPHNGICISCYQLLWIQLLLMVTSFSKSGICSSHPIHEGHRRTACPSNGLSIHCFFLKGRAWQHSEFLSKQYLILHLSQSVHSPVLTKPHAHKDKQKRITLAVLLWLLAEPYSLSRQNKPCLGLFLTICLIGRLNEGAFRTSTTAAQLDYQLHRVLQ